MNYQNKRTKNVCRGRGSIGSRLSPALVETPIGTYGSKTEFPFKRVEMGGTITVDNPNLHLMSRLGLLNPVAIAWELVPFSFVVDWFSNIGSVLNSYTDFAGINLTNTWTTTLGKKVVTDYYTHYPNYVTPPAVTFAWQQKSCIYLSRAYGITMPSFSLRGLKLPSVTRGLTAISLLTQFLGQK